MSAVSAMFLCLSAFGAFGFGLFMVGAMRSPNRQFSSESVGDGLRSLGVQFASAAMYGIIALIIAAGSTSLHWSVSMGGIMLAVLVFQIGIYLIYLGSIRRSQ